MNVGTARHILKTRGFKGLLLATREKLLIDVFSKQYYWYLGKQLERRGNIITMEGCSFSLDSPIIPTKFKGELLFEDYEGPERRAVERFLDPSLPIVELGGAIGVVSCLANRRLSDPSRHVVVEANPALIPLLEENRKRNGCKFTILERVVAYGDEQAVFHSNSSNFLGSTALTEHVHDTVVGDVLTDIQVPTTNLKSVLDQYGFDKCTLICDIEGAERELVQRESDVIGERVMMIIIEVHGYFLGEEGVKNLIARLKELGFKDIYHEAETYVLQKDLGNAQPAV